MAGNNVINLQGPLRFVEPGHEKNSYEAGPFIREIDNRRTAQEPHWNDAQTITFLGKCLQGPALEWYDLFFGRAQETGELAARKGDWQACMAEWRSNFHLSEETHRTNTVDLFRYEPGMHPRNYHLKVAAGAHRLMSQNQQRIWHNTFPNLTVDNLFLPTRDRHTNQEINLQIPGNEHENVDNITPNQRATAHGRVVFLINTEQKLNVATRHEFFWVIKMVADRYPWDKMRKRAYEVDREMANDLSVTYFFKTMESFYENEIRGKSNVGKANVIEGDHEADINKVSNNKNKGGHQNTNNQNKGKDNKKGKKKKAKNKTCSYCNKFGHWRKDCNKLRTHKKEGRINEIQAADDDFECPDDGQPQQHQQQPPPQQYPGYQYPQHQQYPPAPYNTASGNGPWGQA